MSIEYETSTARTSSTSTDATLSLSARRYPGFGAAMPATSPPVIAAATSTAPIQTHQRIAALRSSDSDRDTQRRPRKAGTSVVLHFQVSGGAAAFGKPLGSDGFAPRREAVL